MIDLRQMRTEQIVWTNKNFPGRPAWQPLLGMYEELGELDDASSKDDIVDAVADVGVFMGDFCNAEGFDFAELYEKASLRRETSMKRPTLVSALGRVAHSYLKRAQGIRGTREEHTYAIEDALIDALVALITISRARDFEFLWALEVTWTKVKDRVWRCQHPSGCGAGIAKQGSDRCAAHEGQ